MSRTKYTYKDFATGKPKFTRGIFVGWTSPNGPLNVPYAKFLLRTSCIFVPLYCVTTETMKLIGEPRTGGNL